MVEQVGCWAEIGCSSEFLVANQAFCDRAGCSVMAVLALTICDVAHVDDLPESLDGIELVIGGRIPRHDSLDEEVAPQLRDALDQAVSEAQRPGDVIRLRGFVIHRACEAMDRSSRRELAVATDLRSDASAVVAVSDTGSGINREAAGKLFRPFITMRQTGMSVGLLGPSSRFMEEKSGSRRTQAAGRCSASRCQL